MPKIVDPEQKRAEFVEASWDVIADEGLRAATLRRVAASAGCTTGSLTHYFSDRRALLTDALRAAHDQAGARMIEAASRHQRPFEQLAAVVLEALPLDQGRLREWRVWLAFWAESANDSGLAAENERRYAEWRNLLARLISPFVEDEIESQQEVDYLVALIDGLGLRLARQRPRGRKLAAERRACERAALHGLQKFQPGDGAA